jgi:uncharacterized membrane protein YphA (DoxX/SURF4 family)
MGPALVTKGHAPCCLEWYDPGVALQGSPAMHVIATMGRIVFAIAMIAFGILCLVYVDFVNSLQPVPASTPGYAYLAVATGVLLVVAGLAILGDFRVPLAATVLAGLFSVWIVLLHVPSAFLDPVLLRSPWWIRTFETLAFTGTALILAGEASGPSRARWAHIGRVLFGVSLPVFGVLHFVYADNVASLIPAWYPWPLFWAYFTGLAHAAAGVAIAANLQARLAATLAGIMYGAWALTLHLPRILDNPASYQGDRPELTSLFVATAFCGAAWIVAGSLSNRTAHRLAAPTLAERPAPEAP